MTTRRRKVRRARRLQVTFWRRDDSRGYPGFTTNISMTGMFIGTHSPLPRGTRLRIEVIDREHGFVVEGVVVHARRGGHDLVRLNPPGMGVRFLAVEELVRELVPGAEGEEVYMGPVAGESPARPAARPAGSDPGAAPIPTPDLPPAVPISGERVFNVRFPDASRFLEVFRRDIASGGLFVSTPEPARIQEVVTIDLHPPLPGAEAIRCRARVVHRAEPRPDAGLAGPNLLAGMGVELLDTPAVCERLRPFLERLSGA